MAGPYLGVVVVRATDVELTASFYRAIGLTLVREQHGNGPVHLSGMLGGTLFEIYPARPGRAPDRLSAGATTLGFRVDSLDQTLEVLRSTGAPILRPPHPSPWGRRALVQDPDGRAVDLNEAPRDA